MVPRMATPGPRREEGLAVGAGRRFHGPAKAMRSHVACLLALLIAQPCARAQAAPDAVRPFRLGDVRLLDGPFRRAMERNEAYLLSIEPDRLLHNTRLYAGLEPKGELYGGWESGGIAGHTLGHYLTAISQQYAATGDARFKARIDYIVSEMAQCQRLYGDGYIGALPPRELATLRGFAKGVIQPWGPHTFLGGSWVPWYTEHKVLNGLKDAWILGGCAQARDVALRLADFVDTLTAGLSDDQLQTMLEVEHGGMVDVLVELYALTGNPRYLETARRFRHRAVLDPLLARRDELNGLHSNTQIPKIIGEARSYEATGDPQGRQIAEYFWDTVVRHHSYVIGGNSDDEHFFDEEATQAHLDAATAETCNTYNMLKLTEHLFTWEPRVEYSDYYERALYNDILASQDPELGMFTYFMSLEPGLFKTYSTPTESFWCCVGTGMENHTKYGAAIYYHGADALYVNLFIPSKLTWRDRGLVLRQDTDYPRGNTTRLTVLSSPPAPLAFRVRCPGWAAGPVLFELNGARLDVPGSAGTFAEVRRVWKKGDQLKVTIPMAVRTEALAGPPGKVAFLYGPAVLAGDLGPGPRSDSVPYSPDNRTNLSAEPVPVPILVLGDQPAESSIVRSPGEALQFVTSGLDHPRDITLRPFWEISYNRYNVYWNVMTDAQWSLRGISKPLGW